MFTGIIETLGLITEIKHEQRNITFTVKSDLAKELSVDQSVSHNGVCLTVVNVKGDTYQVTAIDETLNKSSLSQLKVGDDINLERAMKFGARLDGHLVQGHVDQIGQCKQITSADGSWIITFTYTAGATNITVEKGSITVNGVSLTVVNSMNGQFSVAIIPYTFEHTNFKHLNVNDSVNLEFDIIGKYVARLMPQ